MRTWHDKSKVYRNLRGKSIAWNQAPNSDEFKTGRRPKVAQSHVPKTSVGLGLIPRGAWRVQPNRGDEAGHVCKTSLHEGKHQIDKHFSREISGDHTLHRRSPDERHPSLNPYKDGDTVERRCLPLHVKALADCRQADSRTPGLNGPYR